jgi:hypothetical protein
MDLFDLISNIGSNLSLFIGISFISLAEIIELLGSIDYEFYTPDKLISKTVHHYLLRQTGGELNVANDPDQEAVDAQWFELSELNSVLAHENEKRMARGVVEWYERSL